MLQHIFQAVSRGQPGLAVLTQGMFTLRCKQGPEYAQPGGLNLDVRIATPAFWGMFPPSRRRILHGSLALALGLSGCVQARSGRRCGGLLSSTRALAPWMNARASHVAASPAGGWGKGWWLISHVPELEGGVEKQIVVTSG